MEVVVSSTDEEEYLDNVMGGNDPHHVLRTPGQSHSGGALVSRHFYQPSASLVFSFYQITEHCLLIPYGQKSRLDFYTPYIIQKAISFTRIDKHQLRYDYPRIRVL